MNIKKWFLSLLLGTISIGCIQFSISILSVRHYQNTGSTVSTSSTLTARTSWTVNKTDAIHKTMTSQSPVSKKNVSSIVSKKNVSSIVSKWRLKNSTDLLLTIDNIGRMGNWMFQYASLLGIAQINQMRPFVTKSNKLLKYFDLTFVEEHDTKKGKWVRVQEKCYACYDKNMEKLPRKNVSGFKYFQSWKYFHQIESLVRKEFTFKPNIEKAAKDKFKRYIQNQTKPIIAVHIRRTDMTTKTEIRMGYVTAPLSYFEKAMQHMISRFGNVTFLVATDDVKWCRQNLKRNDVIVIDKGDSAVDMAILAMCDHMIMSVGTYSWWAAWLTNGHTVYFKDTPTQGTFLSRSFIKEDHFLPDWIPLGF